jgi:excisionase family DNA binding protein
MATTPEPIDPNSTRGREVVARLSQVLAEIRVEIDAEQAAARREALRAEKAEKARYRATRETIAPPASQPTPTPPAPPPSRLLYDSREARVLLGGISERTFRKLTASGALRTVKQGARVYVRRQDLEAYVAGLPNGETST